MVASSSLEIRDLVVGVAKAAASKAGVEIKVAPPPRDVKALGETVKEYLQLWVSLGSLYYLDQVIKSLLLQVRGLFVEKEAGLGSRVRDGCGHALNSLLLQVR